MSSLCNSPLEKVEKACDGRGRHSSETFEPRVCSCSNLASHNFLPCCFTFGCNGSSNSHARPAVQGSTRGWFDLIVTVTHEKWQACDNMGLCMFLLYGRVKRPLKFSKNAKILVCHLSSSIHYLVYVSFLLFFSIAEMPHAERLSLQGFNIAGGFLDTWRQFLQEDIQQLH